MVLRVPAWTTKAWTAEQEYAVKRLEAALKVFGPGFHVYQYLFKSNRPEIPFANYDDPVVQTQRSISAGSSSSQSATASIRSKSSIASCSKVHGRRQVSARHSLDCFHDPAGGVGELKASSRTTA